MDVYTNFHLKSLKWQGISDLLSNYTCRTPSHVNHQPPLAITMGGIQGREQSNIQKHTDTCISLNVIHSQSDFNINSPTSVNFNNFTILAQQSDEASLRISEALYIHFHQPTLNSKSSKALHIVDNSRYVLG